MLINPWFATHNSFTSTPIVVTGLLAQKINQNLNSSLLQLCGSETESSAITINITIFISPDALLAGYYIEINHP